MSKNFRIPQPKDLNLCDYCYKNRVFTEGSIFLEHHYLFCTKQCKNEFFIETEKFLNDDIENKTNKCDWCKGNYDNTYRIAIIENDFSFCSEQCSDKYFGRLDPYHWRKKCLQTKS
jgi:hypothetical protein